MTGLTAAVDDLNGTRGGGGYSVLIMQLLLLLYFQTSTERIIVKLFSILVGRRIVLLNYT